MNKTRRLAFFDFAIVLFSSLLFSCSSYAGWYTDMAEAKNAALKQNVPILLLISKDGTKDAVMESKDFVNAFAKKYILLFADLTSDTVPLLASQSKESIIVDYFVKEQKEYYIISEDGYVLQHLPISQEVKTAQDILTLIEIYSPQIENVREAIASVKAKSGVEKVKAIDALYEVTQEEYRNPLYSFYDEVIELDKNNSTALVGKYKLLSAYSKARTFIQNDQYEDACSVFISTAQDSYLDNSQKAEAWYAAALVLSVGGSTDYDRMLVMLNKAYENNSVTIHGDDIALRIKLIENMKQVYKENE